MCIHAHAQAHVGIHVHPIAYNVPWYDLYLSFTDCWYKVIAETFNLKERHIAFVQIRGFGNNWSKRVNPNNLPRENSIYGYVHAM